MLPNMKHLLGALSLSLTIRRKSCGGLLLCNIYGFCTRIDSSDLPDWFRYAGDQGTCDSEDDFILHYNTKNFGVDGLSVFGSDVEYRHEHIEGLDSYIEKISRVLRSNLSSQEATLKDLDGCGVEISKDLVDRVLKRFNNEWKSALVFFRWVALKRDYRHDADSYNAMVDILGKMKQFDEMWDLVEEMNRVGGLISLTTMSKIMRRFAGVRKWRDAVDAFHEMERFGLRHDAAAMNALLDTLCKEHRVERAREVFVELRDKIQPDAHTFNILIHGWCKSLRLDEAKWTMEEMQRYGFQPSVVSYTVLIEAYCGQKDFRKVESLLDEMRAKGCDPNVITYTIVMHSLGKVKDTDGALEIFEKMKRNGCSPDTPFLNSLLYITGISGRLQVTQGILSEMIKSGNSPNVSTYNTLISIACFHSQEEYAVKLLRKMERSSCDPNLETYAPLLKLFCKKKRMKVLAYLLTHMHRKDISLDLGTYTLLINGLSRAKRPEHACLLFKEMVLNGIVPKHDTYHLLMEELDNKNMLQKKDVIGYWMEKAQSTRKLGPRKIDSIKLC